MRVFQVFSHPTPPIEPYYGWMRKIRSLSESYTLVAPENFMGGDFAPIDRVWAEMPAYFRERPNGHNQFDPLRAYYLSRHFDHVYFDIDVELFNPIALKPWPQSDGPGVMAGNGDAEMGFRCWQTYLRLAPQFSRPATLMFVDCYSERIKEKPYTHHYARGRYFMETT